MQTSRDQAPVLLLTAFEPFDGAPSNASMILLEKLEKAGFDGRIRYLGPIPVSFAEAFPAVESVLKNAPEIAGVIALGQAEGRSRISLERVAHNHVAARIPDNKGLKPPAGRIDADAPELLWTGFPWQQLPLTRDWECSYSAGSYVCNTLMFQLLTWAQREGRRAGFIHVPLLKSQAPRLEKTPQMDDESAARALIHIIRFALDSMAAV